MKNDAHVQNGDPNIEINKSPMASGKTEKSVKHSDLEIKDAMLIFRSVWSELESLYSKTKLCFPKEIIWLGGAPGAGKGTNTPFIQKERGFTCEPIVVSSLLDTEEARKIKDAGGMVGDREVIGILLKVLLEEEYQSGVIVDGFPRTKVQVEFLKLFYNKTIEIKNEFSNTPIGANFRYPIFRITVLFVEEKVSIERQLKRGKEAQEHNAKAGEGGEKVEIRATDFDEDLARNRYRVFKEQTYEALNSLKEHFHYHFINAEGDISEVEWNIAKEFQYQSSLELDEELFNELRGVPLASEASVHMRQEMVKRLESYYQNDRETFHTVIRIIEEEFSPVIQRHAASGYVIINSENKIFENHDAVAMLVDVLSERGFRSAVDTQIAYVPKKINPVNQEIVCETKKRYAIHVRFMRTDLRR